MECLLLTTQSVSYLSNRLSMMIRANYDVKLDTSAQTCETRDAKVYKEATPLQVAKRIVDGGSHRGLKPRDRQRTREGPRWPRVDSERLRSAQSGRKRPRGVRETAESGAQKGGSMMKTCTFKY